MKIDTSTTAGMIELMQEFNVNGKEVQRRPRDATTWLDVINPNWNWGTCDFRLKPQTVEEAARDAFDSDTTYISVPRDGFILGATWGAQWQKEQSE